MWSLGRLGAPWRRGARFGHGCGRSAAWEPGGKARERGGARRPPRRISTTSPAAFYRGQCSGSAMGLSRPLSPSPERTLSPARSRRDAARAVRAAHSAPVSPVGAAGQSRSAGPHAALTAAPAQPAGRCGSFSLEEQHRAPCRSSDVPGPWHRNAGRNSLKEVVK